MNVFYCVGTRPRGGWGGGQFSQLWVGVCGPLSKTLTLYTTKIYDISYPFYDLAKNYDLTLKSKLCF